MTIRLDPVGWLVGLADVARSSHMPGRETHEHATTGRRDRIVGPAT
jgi:hypothetical protein